MANCKSMYWWIISLSVTTFLIISSKGASVNLTVETKGVVSLVGPHCPENVSLFCEGVELTSIRWRYNGNMNIISYFPDKTSTSADLAFFMPQLVAVERNLDDLNFANFSSTLTANISQLITNNVTEISCGAPGISQVEPVNVSIIEQSIPNSPTITMVTAAYQSGELNSVEVTWEKLENFCPFYGLFFTYEVNLNSVQVNHSSTNCGEVLCMVSFKNLTGETKEYNISIKAENEVGSSDLVLYPFSIGQQIQQYLIPVISSNDHELFGRCTAAGNFAGSAVCFVQYTTDSMYRDLSNITNVTLGTTFSVLENPLPGTTYYFQFSLLVNNTLQITERTMYIFNVQSDAGIPSYGIALIVIAVIITLCLVVLMALISFLVHRRTVGTASIAQQTENKGPTFEKDSAESTASIENKMENEGEEAKVWSSPAFVEGFVLEAEKKPFLFLDNVDVRPYTAYKVVIRLQDKTESRDVYRSYNNFSSMYNKVKENYQWLATELEFPGVDTRNQDCQERLNNFITDLMKIPGIQDFPPVQEFLSDTKMDPQTDILHITKKLTEQPQV